MSGIGEIALVSGALQLTVPSYALRLVRRFGTRQVGWFLVASFSCLAALHLLKPLQPMNMGAASAMTLEIVFAIAAALLLIGLCHLEALLAQRQESERTEHRLRERWESQAQQQNAELAQANQELARRLAQLEQSADALRVSVADYRQLFEANPHPMWIFDLRSLHILAANQAALGQYQLAEGEFRGMSAHDLLPRSGLSRFVQDAARPCSSAQCRGVWQHRRKDGSVLEVEVTALDLHYAGVPARLVLALDVRPRREQERAMCEARKQEVAARLASGVAHHLNNILSVISGYANLLLHRSRDEESSEPLRQISAAAGRAAALSRQLQMASGHFAMRNETVDLNSLLAHLDSILVRLSSNGIRLERSFAPGLPPIVADSRLVEHVVVNLVLNARDAMTAGGTLALSTGLVQGPEGHPGTERAESRARYIRLSVRDTGSGIAPEIEPHLFEPFFSTREVGKGLGLGLASVQGAVKQQGGWIEYTTEPGRGTEFRVFFPAADPVAAPRESEFRRWVRH